MENNNENNVPQLDEKSMVTPSENNTVNIVPENPSEQSIVKPVEDRRDLADKTIDTVESFLDTKISEFTTDDINKNKNNALICYIPFVCLYFVFNGGIKKSAYLKYHANQGLDLTILSVLVYFGTKVLSSIFEEDAFLVNSIPTWLEVIIAIMYFICFLYMLFGVISTVNGTSRELPIIGKIKLIR